MKITIPRFTWAGAAASALLLTINAHGNTIVFNNLLQSGSQQGYELGMDFNVNRSINIVSLGAFDSNGDGFGGAIKVGIFDRNTGLLVGSSATLTGTSGTLIAGSRFVDARFTLAPGAYSIVAVGFTGLDLSGNSGIGGIETFNSVGGALSLVPVGGRYKSGGTFELPTAGNGGTVGGYGQSDPVFQAGTFATPDVSSTSMLMGFGLLAMGWVRRLAK